MNVRSLTAGWIDATARRADTNPAQVQETLDRYDFYSPGVAARPHKLTIIQIHFSGVKPVGRTRSAPEPFTFTWDLRAGVNAVTTHGKNEAGKSTVLEVARWALRGHCGLQADTRTWIRQILVEILIDDERLVIGFSVTEGRPQGRVLRVSSTDTSDGPTFSPDEPALRAMSSIVSGAVSTATVIDDILDSPHGTVIARFHGHADFERTISGLMLDRLGFERLTGWQSLPKELAAMPGEGVPSKLDWGTWSNVLTISGLKVLLGNEVEHSARLLQIYLGTSWAGTAVDLKTVLRKAEQRAVATRRRNEQDVDERRSGIERLRLDIESLDDELHELKATAPSIANLENLLDDLEQSVRERADASVDFIQAKAALDDANSALLLAGAELLALTEATVSRRFFHSLTPTCCPRCDTALSIDRFRREVAGQCSLCSEPLDLHNIPLRVDAEAGTTPSSQVAPVDESSDESSVTDEAAEIRRDIEALTVQRAQVRLAYQAAKTREEEIAERVARARTRVDEASSVASAARRIRAIELDLAGKRAILDDYESRVAPMATSGSDENEADIIILKAALKEAENRRDSEQKGLLDAVSGRIFGLGRSFGLDELESVRLNGAVQLYLRKGGENTSYSKCTSGEQLRLKVATVVSLLQVGRSTGVGRHPGLLLVDSVGAEEMGENDLKNMLRSLRDLADEGPQLIIASARAATLSEVLPSEAMRVAPVGGKLW